MHEFDKHILKYLFNLTNQINSTQNRTDINYKVRSKSYTRASSKKRRIVDQIKALASKLAKPIKDYNFFEKRRLKNITKGKRKIKSILVHTKSTANHRKLVKFIYTRYADDWIILSNSTKEITEQIKKDNKRK
jgi:hypothetical protein